MAQSSRVRPLTCCFTPATRSTRPAGCDSRSSTGGRCMRTNRIMIALALAAGLVGFGPSIAQDKAKEKSGKSAKAAAKDTAKKPGPITAIVGADVYTVTRGVVRSGTVLVQDGKILNVGQDVAVPAGATVIDAAGKIVTPGFVAVTATGVGLRAGGGGPGGGGGGPAARPART